MVKLTPTVIIKDEYSSPPCPDDVRIYTYEITAPDYQHIINNGNWYVEGGDIIQSYGYKVTIKWHDVDTGRIYIYGVAVTTYYNNNTQYWYNGSASKKIKIKSLNNINPGNISGESNIPIGTSSNYTYSIPSIKYWSGDNVSEYSWTIPQGWTSNGVISTGTNIYKTNNPQISVTYDNCTGGNISVWADNKLCTGNSTNIRSKTISRTVPLMSIDGPQVICSTGNYSINLPSGYILNNWSSSYNISRIGNINENPCLFNSLYENMGWIGATIINQQCGTSYNIQKDIRLNGPAYNDIYLDLYTSDGQKVNYMCENRHYHIYVMNTGPCNTTNYTWNVPTSWNVNYTWSNMISVYTNATPGGMVEVFANICCGQNKKIHIGYMQSGYCPNYYYMSISPNPADSYFGLFFSAENETYDKENKIKVIKQPGIKEEGIGNYSVKLIDKQGNILKTFYEKSLICQFSLDGLKSDTYIVHVKIGNEIYKSQLIVNKN